MTHVITIASGSTIIVKVSVAIVLVEGLVIVESPSVTLVVVEWTIIKIVVILKWLEIIRVILSERVFILHADSRSPNWR